MTSGAFASTAANALILAADEHREVVELQHLTGSPVYLNFGSSAVDASGVALVAITSPFYRVEGLRARMAIYGICGAGLSATGGYQTE